MPIDFAVTPPDGILAFGADDRRRPGRPLDLPHEVLLARYRFNTENVSGTRINEDSSPALTGRLQSQFSHRDEVGIASTDSIGGRTLRAFV